MPASKQLANYNHMAKITIQKLIKRTDEIQKLMTLEAVQRASQRTEDFELLRNKIKKLALETCTTVEVILQSRNQSAADLPVRTRRAYQWAAYLCRADNLEQHLDSLQRVNLFLPGYQSKFRNKIISFRFYHLGSLYKITDNTREKHISAQECFIHAPDRILTALIDTAFNLKSAEPRQLIRDYTFAPEYKKARISLEYLGLPAGSFGQGKVHSLEQSFNRVNRDYFQGNLQPPHLVWSARLTYRKFGHYQWDIDTVMVSRTLDDDRFPEFVIDFVMYHELLHKKMQTKKVNERRYSHTKKFREEEKKFARYDEAKRILNRVSQKKS